MSNLLATVLQGAGLAGLFLAAAVDFRTRTIPNEIVIWVMGAGLLSRLIADGWSSWISVLAAVGVFVPLGLLASREVVGGGDAKMIAAATLLVESIHIPRLLLAIALAGGVLAASYLAASCVLVVRRALRPEPPGAEPAEPHDLGVIGFEAARITAREPMPFGLAIVAGSAFVFLYEAF